MKLWLLEQDSNRGYDTFDSAVVAAETEDEARKTKVGYDGTWCHPDYVRANLIGVANEGTTAGLILGSFNAG